MEERCGGEHTRVISALAQRGRVFLFVRVNVACFWRCVETRGLFSCIKEVLATSVVLVLVTPAATLKRRNLSEKLKAGLALP